MNANVLYEGEANEICLLGCDGHFEGVLVALQGLEGNQRAVVS